MSHNYKKNYNLPLYPENSKELSDKGFLKIDNGSLVGTHWTCFIVKMINHTILPVSEDNHINFYSINYLYQ